MKVRLISASGVKPKPYCVISSRDVSGYRSGDRHVEECLSCARLKKNDGVVEMSLSQPIRSTYFLIITIKTNVITASIH